METIPVHASTPYQVMIDKHLLLQTGELVKKLKKKYHRIAVITDSNVDPLYSSKVTQSLEHNNYTVLKYVFPAGEESKNINNVMTITSWLSQNAFTRSDLLVALGGGVCGDLVGFIASIYLRGIDFIQIPTTLLAAVDSSVGGKTGINIPEGKNLVGSFWQPQLVICDTTTFSTLSDEIFADGIAEAIKYGCIWDKELFSLLSNKDWLENNIEYLVAKCVSIKATIVSQDEKETGLRQILNFGHTLGHSIEKKSKFSITHGQGVAIGMYLIARCGEIQEITDKETSSQIKKVLTTYNLPYSTEFTIDDLMQSTLGDKKRFEDTINFITLREIGTYSITPIHIDKIDAFLEGVI